MFRGLQYFLLFILPVQRCIVYAISDILVTPCWALSKRDINIINQQQIGAGFSYQV